MICIKWLTADLAASDIICPRNSKGNGARPTLGSSPKISWLTWDLKNVRTENVVGIETVPK